VDVDNAPFTSSARHISPDHEYWIRERDVLGGRDEPSLCHELFKGSFHNFFVFVAEGIYFSIALDAGFLLTSYGYRHPLLFRNSYRSNIMP